MPRWERYWPEFEALMKERLQNGYEQYGDWSFDRPPTQLLEEIEQELWDVIGWSFILWTRVRALAQKVEVELHEPPN